MSTPSPFAQPGAGGDKFDLKANGTAWIGALMLVWPVAFRENFDSGQFEPTDVVEADIALIDRVDPTTGKPLFFKNAFIFSKGLVSNTRNELGGIVLGRLNKKQFANGIGWYMDPFQPQDAATAEAYLATNPRATFSAPATPAAAPAPAPAAYGAPAVPQYGAPAPAPAAAAPASYGSAVSAPAPAAPQWGAPPPAAAAPAAPPAAVPAPTGNGIASWPAGLADFLASKGVDPATVQDQNTAEMIARSFPA